MSALISSFPPGHDDSQRAADLRARVDRHELVQQNLIVSGKKSSPIDLTCLHSVGKNAYKT